MIECFATPKPEETARFCSGDEQADEGIGPYAEAEVLCFA